MKPVFLTLAEVLTIHNDQIERYGGIHGIRDLELLKSAVGMPGSMFGGKYLHTNIPEMAAAYLFHIVSNHPFIDGNKRAGAVSAIVFIELNGWEFIASEDELFELVLGIAQGNIGKTEVMVAMERFAVKKPDKNQ